MRALPAALALVLLLPALAALHDARALLGGDASSIAFAAPQLIDGVRAGGEPVIAALHDGTIVVSAHPGFTHYHPSADPTHLPTELVQDYGGQSYLWRSTDGGASFQEVGLPLPAGLPQDVGPRSTGPGVSDPDMTVDGNGRIYHTDLFAAGASVSWSDDAGRTWLPGNALAAGQPLDRQWLASHGDAVYFTANFYLDHHLLRSDDGGLTWTKLGNVPCGGDIVAAPDGTLYAASGAHVCVSTNGGTSWSRSGPAGHTASGLQLNEPAVDGAGNVWIAWQEHESGLWLAGSPDHGASWPWVLDLTAALRSGMGAESGPLVLIWPWVSAGSDGRVAVTVYATPTSGSSSAGALDRPWSVASVAVFGADTAQPSMAGYLLASDIHDGPICQSGTTCEVNSVRGDPSGDRRLGDFFETTIAPDGALLVAFSDTTAKPDDVISHPGFVRQVGGPRFLVDGFQPLQG